MHGVLRFAGLVAGLVLAGLSAAVAQSDYSTLTSPQSAQNWHLTLGAGLRYTPDYAGSDDYVFRPRPIVSLSRGLKSDWWSAEDDALSVGIFTGRGWRIGFSGSLLWERRADVNPALVAIPNVKFGVEAGGFAEFYPTSWLRARADLRRGFVSHDAAIVDLKLDAFTRIGQGWTVGAGPRATFAGSDYIRTYFGTAAALAGGGLINKYSAGLHSVGAIAQATYNWSDNLKTTAYVEYKRLMGDAVKSPIVTPFGNRNSLTLGVSASYSFDLGM